MECNMDIINQKPCKRATSPMGLSSAKSNMDPISFLNAAAQEGFKIDPIVVDNYTRSTETSDWTCDVSVKFLQHIGEGPLFDCYSVRLPINLTVTGSGVSKKNAKLNACTKLQQYLFQSFTLGPLHTRTTSYYSMGGDEPDLPKMDIDGLEELITFHEIEHAKAQVENEERRDKRLARSTYKYTTISPVFPWTPSASPSTTLPSILFTPSIPPPITLPPTIPFAKLSINSLSTSSTTGSSSDNSGSDEEPTSLATDPDFLPSLPEWTFKQQSLQFTSNTTSPQYQDADDLIAL